MSGESAQPNIATMKKYVKKYSMSQISLVVFEKIKELTNLHEQSPLEFARKDNYVMCTQDYELSVITQERLYEFLLVAEQFINSVDRVVLNTT